MIPTILYFTVTLILMVLQYAYGGGKKWGAKEWWGWSVISITWPVYLIAVPVVLYLWVKDKGEK